MHSRQAGRQAFGPDQSADWPSGFKSLQGDTVGHWDIRKMGHKRL